MFKFITVTALLSLSLVKSVYAEDPLLTVAPRCGNGEVIYYGIDHKDNLEALLCQYPSALTLTLTNTSNQKQHQVNYPRSQVQRVVENNSVVEARSLSLKDQQDNYQLGRLAFKSNNVAEQYLSVFANNVEIKRFIFDGDTVIDGIQSSFH